jgi:uncharacterized membrane protein
MYFVKTLHSQIGKVDEIILYKLFLFLLFVQIELARISSFLVQGRNFKKLERNLFCEDQVLGVEKEFYFIRSCCISKNKQ